MGWVSIKDLAKLYGISQGTVRKRIAKREQFTMISKINNRTHVWIDGVKDSDTSRITTTENQRAVMYAAMTEGVSVTKAMVASVFNVSDSFVSSLSNGDIKVYKDKSITVDTKVLYRKAAYLRYNRKLTYEAIGRKLGVSSSTAWNLLLSPSPYYRRIRKDAL